MTLDECDNAFSVIRGSLNKDELVTAIRALLDVYQVMSFELGRANVFWRGRKCSSQGYSHVSALSYPPHERAKVGRLNDEGKPCLYAATRRSTVFAELGMQVGDYAHVIGFRTLPGKSIRFMTIGDLFHVHKTGYTKSLGQDPGSALSRVLNSFGLERGKRIVYIDAFLGSILADSNAKTSNYEATRILASAAYKKSGAEGMFYPSVQDHVGMNLAILPSAYESKTHITCSQVIQITNVHEFGFYDYKVCLVASGINDTGEFNWQVPELEDTQSLVLFNLTKDEASFLNSKGMQDSNAYLDLINGASKVR